MKHTDTLYDTSWNDGVNYAFKSFAERIEFYLEYCSRNDNELDDIPDILYQQYSNSTIRHWNDWLFDYCFGEVIE